MDDSRVVELLSCMDSGLVTARVLAARLGGYWTTLEVSGWLNVARRMGRVEYVKAKANSHCGGLWRKLR